MKKEQKINKKNMKNDQFKKIQKEKNSNLFIWVLVSVLSLVIFISAVLTFKYLNIFLQGKQSSLESVEKVYKNYYNSKWFEPIIDLRNIVLGPIGIKSMFSFKNATSLGDWSNPVILDGIINWIFFAISFLLILFMLYKILKKIFFTFTSLPEKPEVEKKAGPEIVTINKKQKFVVLKRIEKNISPLHDHHFCQKPNQIFNEKRHLDFEKCKFCGNFKKTVGFNLNKHSETSNEISEDRENINININLVKNSD